MVTPRLFDGPLLREQLMDECGASDREARDQGDDDPGQHINYVHDSTIRPAGEDALDVR